MTDAFTKCAKIVAISNKGLFTVAPAIFKRWICPFGTPLEIIADQGKKFCAKLTKDLFQLLQITHSTTTAKPQHYHRDQLILLQDSYNINRNAMIAPRWTGPHHIDQLQGHTDVSLKLNSKEK